jgi:hypothetical protein
VKPYAEMMRTYLPKPMSRAIGTLNRNENTVRFKLTLAEQVVPASIDVAVNGKALFMGSFNNTQSIRIEESAPFGAGQ